MPWGSACMVRLCLCVLLLTFRRIDFLSGDGEVGTIHAAQIAAAALFGSDDVRRMVSLRIESGRKRENLGRTELHAKSARLTAFDNDRNTSFGHGNPPRQRALGALKTARKLWLGLIARGCDGRHGWT